MNFRIIPRPITKKKKTPFSLALMSKFALFALASAAFAQSTDWIPVVSPDFNQVSEALGVAFAEDG
jgi:hypothetical protein